MTREKWRARVFLRFVLVNRESRLANAHLEADEAGFAGQERARELPAQGCGAGIVGLSGEVAGAVASGRAGDVLVARRQAIGDNDVGDGLAAAVGVAQEKRDDVADQA